jgi:hypothetical protein
MRQVANARLALIVSGLGLSKPLEELSLADLEAFRTWLEQQGMAASSRKCRWP